MFYILVALAGLESIRQGKDGTVDLDHHRRGILADSPHILGWKRMVFVLFRIVRTHHPPCYLLVAAVAGT